MVFTASHCRVVKHQIQALIYYSSGNIEELVVIILTLPMG